MTLQEQLSEGGPDLAHIDWSKVALGCNTVPQLIDHCAEHYADQDLIAFDNAEITYGEAFAASERLAGQLMRAGIGKGQRVGLLLPNGPDFAVSWLAITRIGAVAVPISTLSSERELRRIIASSSISLLILTEGYLRQNFLEIVANTLDLGDAARDQLPSRHAPYLRAIWSWSSDGPDWCEPIHELAAGDAELVRLAEDAVTPDDPISIIYTSGSTSAPKGVIHSHGSFLRSAQSWGASMDYRRGDRVFNAAPLFWVGGLVTGLLVLMEVGATLVGTSANGTKLVDVIVNQRCTLIGTSVHQTRQIMSDPLLLDRNFGAVRGGSIQAILPPELQTKNQIYFGNALGMTETAGPHTLAVPDVDDDHIGSMGPLAPGMEHRIVDSASREDMPLGEHGELLVRGHTMMIGYVGRERDSIFDRDGWFPTGDICSYRNGHLFLHGRLDSLIKSAGANVAPPEVEQALMAIEGVEGAVVVGLPDTQRGQIVGAVVVLVPDCSLDAGSVIAGARAMLSPYKVPRRILFTEAIPLTGTGKPDRVAVRALLEVK